FALTSIAFDPSLNTIYAADSASTNVYLIDGAAGAVSSAVYTNGIGPITTDLGATQNMPGTAPSAVVVNSVTGQWAYMSPGGGAKFTGTSFGEAAGGRAWLSGGAWDSSTGIMYSADGFEFYATANLKFLEANFACAGGSNAVAVSSTT